MRITIDIPDEIHARLKARAKEEGTTMRAIILRGIEKEWGATDRGRPSGPNIPSTRTDKLVLENEQIYNIIYFPRPDCLAATQPVPCHG
jgi:hypothetical protein